MSRPAPETPREGTRNPTEIALYLGPLVVLAGAAAAYLFGIHGVGRSGLQNFDGAVFYAAGKAWLAGLNPYVHADLERSVAGMGLDLVGIHFFYPPQSSLLCIPQALFSYPVARLLWLSVNCLALAAMAAMAYRLMKDELGESASSVGRLGPWLLAAIVLGNPFAAHVLWMGQSSIVASCGLFAAWYLHRKGQPVLAGVALGIATFKPQLCLLLVLWWALEREWKTLLVAGATSVCASAGALLSQGPVGAVAAWLTSVTSGYSALVANTPGFQHKVGLESLLHAAGIAAPGYLFTGIAIVLCSVAWRYRGQFRKQDAFALLVLTAFVFVGYSHDYDYIALAPVWVAAWQLGRAEPRFGIGLVLLHLALFVPQRLLRPLELPVLNHWRTGVLLIVGLVILEASRRAAGSRSPERALRPDTA